MGELKYNIRPMLPNEIPAVVELWRDTDLTDGEQSVQTWYKCDAGGFYVAVLEDGTVIGACAGVLLNENLAFMGLYVVSPAYRGKGIGIKIWNAVLERVREKNVGVNAVPHQLENYRDKSGFSCQAPWYSVVCVAEGIDATQMNSDVIGVEIKSMLTTDQAILDKLISYDENVMGYSRRTLVPLTCGENGVVCKVAVNESTGAICGYGIIKNDVCKGSAFIAPLYADNEQIAEAIICELVKAFHSRDLGVVVLMTIDCNQAALELTKRLGFEHAEKVPRLYTKNEVVVEYKKVFAQQSLNFSIF